MSGTSTNRSSSGPTKQTPKLLPPHYLVLALGTIGACVWLPGPVLLPAAWRPAGLLAGLLLIAGGVAVAVRGSRQFAQAGTNIVPFTNASTLVSDGVFRWTRNPMYLGMLLTLTGSAVLVDSLWALGVVLAFFLLIRQAFVQHEEAQMRATFGPDFEAYCARTRRWL